jgi:hypothetical protein
MRFNERIGLFTPVEIERRTFTLFQVVEGVPARNLEVDQNPEVEH